MGADAQINASVYDYLVSIGSKVASKFFKEQKPEQLPQNSPKIKDVFSVYNQHSPKRKMNGTAKGETPAKKAKKEESSSDDDSAMCSDEETEDKKGKGTAKAVVNGKAPKAEKKEESSEDEDDSEEEERKTC